MNNTALGSDRVSDARERQTDLRQRRARIAGRAEIDVACGLRARVIVGVTRLG